MKKTIILLTIVLSAMLALVGCQTADSTATATPQVTKTPTAAATTGATAAATEEATAAPEPVTISLVGSTSVQPLAEMLAEAYMAKYDYVTVTVQGGGSSVGVKTVGEGSCDIGNASRAVKDSELETYEGMNPIIVCYDGIAVAMHPSNTVEDLTEEQIAAIFKGEITNWSEVGGADMDITVYTREAASGTRGAFVELLELEDGDNVLITDMAIECNGNGVMKTNIAGNEGAIGYVSLGSLDDTLKAVKVGGVEASVDNVKNGSYPLFRPFNMITMGEPEGAVKDFLDFVLGEEGQAIAAEKWIPVE